MKNYTNFTYNKLFEYLQQEEQLLYDYFNMSDDEKYINNTWINQYRIKDFIRTIDLEDFFDEKEIEEFDFDTEDIDNNETEDIFYEFENYYQDKKKEKFLIAFGEYCYEKLDYHNQAANLMFNYPQRFKKDWIVYKNNTGRIAKFYKDGFENGLDEHDELYNWFYDGNQNNQYGDIHIGRPSGDISSYNFEVGQNEDVLMFKSSGVQLSDYSNNIDVVAFYGKAVHDLIWIEYGTSESDNFWEVWYIESKNGERLIEKEELEEVIEWVEKNYDQYRKHFQTDKYEIIQKKKRDIKKKKQAKKFKI